MPKLDPTKEPRLKPDIQKIKQEHKPHYSPGAYDKAYIKAFTEHPELGKKAAIVAAGYVGDYASQEAYRIHNRLRDQIEAILDEKILDGAHVGHSTLVKLCKEAESESVKRQAAHDLIDYAGRKAGDKLIIEDKRSGDELDEEIAAIQQRIAEKEGKRLN